IHEHGRATTVAECDILKLYRAGDRAIEFIESPLRCFLINVEQLIQPVACNESLAECFGAAHETLDGRQNAHAEHCLERHQFSSRYPACDQLVYADPKQSQCGESRHQ